MGGALPLRFPEWESCSPSCDPTSGVSPSLVVGVGGGSLTVV